jgi:hypothetical protein
MFDFRNGKPLMDRLIPDGLSHAATSFVRISQNQFDYGKVRRDRRVVSKRRNVYGERAADLINFYFRAAAFPIRYLSDVGCRSRFVFCAPTTMPPSPAN